jgi:radical SAM protein with 4Fe4S-binding SPASM domain
MKLKLSDYGYNILMIETKLVCNMRCKFCAYPLIDNIGAELSSEEVYSIIDSLDADDDKLEDIYLQKFNEPLLDIRIFDFIKYAKYRGFKVQVITNGLLFKSEKIRSKLIDADPTHITISLQTINENTFKSRVIDSSFEEYKKGIFKFLESSLNYDSNSKITIDVACNFLSYNFLSSKNLFIRKMLGLECGDPSIPNTIQNIQEDLMVLLKELNNHNPSFAYDEAMIKRYLKTIDRNYLNQEELNISNNISIKVKPFIYGRKLAEFYPPLRTVGCETRMMSVSANGSVAPCCLVYNNLLDMGNIKKEALKHILDKNKNFISEIKNGNCMPETCKRCEGAPTRRGALVLSIYRAIKKRL